MGAGKVSGNIFWGNLLKLYNGRIKSVVRLCSPQVEIVL
jgi:hypothetical protein